MAQYIVKNNSVNRNWYYQQSIIHSNYKMDWTQKHRSRITIGFSTQLIWTSGQIKGNYNKYLTSQKRQISTALFHQNMKMNTFGFATKHSCNSCQALLTWFLKLQNAHKVLNNQKLYFQILTKGRNSDSCSPKSMHGM